MLILLGLQTTRRRVRARRCVNTVSGQRWKRDAVKDLISITQIAEILNMSQAYVRDRVVRRPDFPRPSLVLSQKTKRWARDDVEAWVRAQVRAAKQTS
jgi:predicted DNA-binding transcriptional regulator AlpA